MRTSNRVQRSSAFSLQFSLPPSNIVVTAELLNLPPVPTCNLAAFRLASCQKLKITSPSESSRLKCDFPFFFIYLVNLYLNSSSEFSQHFWRVSRSTSSNYWKTDLLLTRWQMTRRYRAAFFTGWMTSCSTTTMISHRQRIRRKSNYLKQSIKWT